MKKRMPIGLWFRFSACALVVTSLAASSGFAQDRGEFDEKVRRGVEAFKAARYLDGVQAFRAAYEIKPDPTLLYNVGQCFERLGRIDDALAHYRTYVEAPGTTSEDRAEAFARIKALEAEREARKSLNEPAAPKLPPVNSEVPSEPPPPPPRVSPPPAAPELAPNPDDLVMLVHTKNPIVSFDADSIREIYLGRQTAWPTGERVKVLTRPASVPAGSKFHRTSEGLDVRTYQKAWQKRQLTGAALAPRSVPTVQVLLQMIAADEGAVGFALASELPKQMQQVRVVPIR